MSIADASSKHIKTITYRNVRALPFNYKMNIRGIGFVPGNTYSISVHVDLNMDKKFTKGEYYNSIMASVPFNRTRGFTVKRDVYMELLN